MDESKPKGRAKGGVARARALTPEQRKAIAEKAAKSRWGVSTVPTAEHVGAVKLGELALQCAVLPDGRRVLSQRGLAEALGRRYGGNDFRNDDEADDGGGKLPFYMAAKSLKPFVDNDLAVVVNSIIPYHHGKGGGIAQGVDASALPKICDVWLKAREAGVLTRPQAEVARRAELLVRGLAHVGIVALVDEATGYQEVRARDALQAYLERFIRKELAAWVKVFPDEFFRELYRLKRWPWSGSSRRPGVVGHYINDLVYSRLGPGVLEQLQEKNPIMENGRRRNRHTQWLSDDLGHPALSQHMFALIRFMRAESSWDEFRVRFYRAFPQRGDNLELDL
ncbi:P63C domain-containing protein [Hydrogenophaga laconesensis]|uniref:Bacteriophage Mx8 p63 C-terminal domain-containing protein n=1 Tax=Hydrogenophaga laconesensis TaxID=1805971 RepID=A0ABU1VDK0_9BURK|nr:P63C domain-containing protein [Hydrogenophaga laconesensis]MDR7095430.1 hypothetical protein [Hydrogenophaga laconesensis]